MLHIILYEPEIPPNTGNIIRLCANTGVKLHLIEPLGFALNDVKLRRAGLDYHEFADVQCYSSLDRCISEQNITRLFAFSTKGQQRFDRVSYQPGDGLIFGPESRGLPANVLNNLPETHRLYLPMQPSQRSLNLSNTVAIAVFEAWRQWGYPGEARAK